MSLAHPFTVRLRRLGFALLMSPMLAQAQAPQAADDPPVVPEVERREVVLPKFPSRDFEVGLFAGTYATQNFGSGPVVGLRAGYHLTEDFFVEGAYGSTRVSDDAFRQILPGGVFPEPETTLSYYNLSAGWNLLPGEVFLGSRQARATAIYLIGGVGSTSFNEQKSQTINLGFGLKLLLGDRAAVRLDVRDHLFSLDLLGKRESTQNLEVTAGVGWHF
ncbi:MAG: outer membrane beta-barrel domain-containing protein [Rubrivivax sp.]|nr:outer membrane beta-barrel domain-containing protein [Rubrivivax sp.]MDH5341013.1 outer membrane beta-barrel domain-containing protein [Rubrivivax sp.]